MKAANKKKNLINLIWNEKCPDCGKGNVYQKTSFFKMPVMNDRCEHCHYKFDREPGYFLGAMYVSYGIAVLAGLITFLALYFSFPGIPTIYLPMTIVAVIIIIARKNYKLSRVIYMHLFPW